MKAQMNKNNLRVLMYHGITTNEIFLPEQREVGAEIYDVKHKEFVEQVDWLKANGYSVDKIDESKEAKSIVMTFDDGEMNNFSHALPILHEKKFKAYFFIIVKRVGKQGYMGLDELKALIDAGMVVGSHGLSHEILTDLNETQIEQELMASKKYLERNLGVRITTLSIPRGFCNDQVLDMAYKAGYETVFISERPKDLEAECFSRVPVKSHWNLNRFEKAVRGKVPLLERFSEMLKNIVIKLFRESGYNHFRNFLIKVFNG